MKTLIIIAFLFTFAITALALFTAADAHANTDEYTPEDKDE
jgi:hypothetical protein